MFGFFKRRAVHYGESSVGAKKEQDEILSIFEFHQKMNFSLFRNNDNVIKIKLPESIQDLLGELDSKRQINRRN